MKGNRQKQIFWAAALLINFQETICIFKFNEDNYSLRVRKRCVFIQSYRLPSTLNFRRKKYINIIFRYTKKEKTM